MSKVVLDMSMSVDGFITGPDDGPDHGLGVDGERLHDWLGAGGAEPSSYRPADETGATVFDELMATGAVITGRRTFDNVELELIRALHGPGVQHLRYRVHRT